MSREIVMAGICTLAVIAIAWLIDHPSKIGGSIFAVVAFAVVVVVTIVRNRSGDRRVRPRILERRRRLGDDDGEDSDV